MRSGGGSSGGEPQPSLAATAYACPAQDATNPRPPRQRAMRRTHARHKARSSAACARARLHPGARHSLTATSQMMFMQMAHVMSLSMIFLGSRTVAFGTASRTGRIMSRSVHPGGTSTLE